MTPQLAISILYGITECESLEQAEAVIALVESQPEILTTGAACRGYEQLRRAVYADLD